MIERTPDRSPVGNKIAELRELSRREARKGKIYASIAATLIIPSLVFIGINKAISLALLFAATPPSIKVWDYVEGALHYRSRKRSLEELTSSSSYKLIYPVTEFPETKAVEIYNGSKPLNS